MKFSELSASDKVAYNKAIKNAFPKYRGRKKYVRNVTGPINQASWWDEGSRSYHALVDLQTGKVKFQPTGHPIFEADNHAMLKEVDIPEGHIALCHSVYGMSAPTMTVIVKE